MGIRNQQTFSDAEWVAAFSLLLPPDAAAAEAAAYNRVPDLHFEGEITEEELRGAPAAGPRSYDDDLLDLLSMVSSETALKAWQLLGVSPVDGQRRREALRVRLKSALRRDPRADW